MSEQTNTMLWLSNSNKTSKMPRLISKELMMPLKTYLNPEELNSEPESPTYKTTKPLTENN